MLFLRTLVILAAVCAAARLAKNSPVWLFQTGPLSPSSSLQDSPQVFHLLECCYYLSVEIKLNVREQDSTRTAA